MWRAPTLQPGREIRDQAPADHWRSGAREILLRHGFAEGELSAFSSGSDVVWGNGQHVVKLSTPRWREAIAWEATVLDHVQGQLPVRTPACLARGEIDGWPYLVMDHVPGQAIGPVWAGLGNQARLALARQIGSVTRALHDLQAPSQAEPWDPFWKQCQERARTRSADSPLEAAVPKFLERWSAWPTHPLAFLHTELLDQHILVEPIDHERDMGSDGAAWRVSALIDFADAHVGAPGYDLPALAEFLFRGEPGAWGAFFDGYRWRERHGPLPEPENCLAFGLQHQFASLPRAMEAAGTPTPQSLEQLARKLYDTGV